MLLLKGAFKGLTQLSDTNDYACYSDLVLKDTEVLASLQVRWINKVDLKSALHVPQRKKTQTITT